MLPSQTGSATLSAWLVVAGVSAAHAQMPGPNRQPSGPALAGQPAVSQPAVSVKPIIAPLQLPPGGGGALLVTSDTAEYCEQLSQRVTQAQLSRPANTEPRERREEVAQLASEGETMCATGRIRGGLTRLRRAWMLLREPD